MIRQPSAPVFLNLFRIRFPVGAVTSIAHRISGFLLFCSLPFFIYLLNLSLQDPQGYADAIALLGSRWLKYGSAIVVWSLFHHLLSGVRFLLIDIDTGVTLRQARRSAWLVNITALFLVLAWCGWIS